MNTTSTTEALWNEWSAGVPERLRNEDGIKAQFAAAIAVIQHLNRQHKDGSWTFQPVPVGGFEDRVLKIDGYLVNGKTRDAYAVDFSLEGAGNPKGNKADAQWLVHLNRDWFQALPDGRWSLRECCMGALVRAFLRTLQNGPVSWTPGIVGSDRKAS